MPALYIPQQREFNQATQEGKNPSAGVPFDPHADQPIQENVNPEIAEALFKRHRAFVIEGIHDQNPFKILQLADIYFLKRDYPKAEKLYKDVISKNKSDLSAYEKLILSTMLQFPQNYQNANPNKTLDLRDRINKYFLNYLESASRRPDILHKYVLFRLSMFIDQKTQIADECLANLKEILEKQPDNYQVIDTVGFVYLNYRDDLGEAKKWFLKAISINKSYVYSINNLGVCFSKENNNNEAKKYFEQARTGDSNFVLAYENLGNIQAIEKDYKNALENLKHAFEISGSISRNGFHNLALSYLECRYNEEAIKLYEVILGAEPDNYLVMNNIGTAYVRLNNKDKAKEYYLKSLKTYKNKFQFQNPNVAGITDTLRNLIRTAVDTKDQVLLLKTVQDLSAINPEDSYIDYAKACEELLSENYPEAEKAFKKLLKKDKNIPEMYVMYSFLLSAVQRDYEGTVSLLLKALKLGYSGLLLDNNLAYAYLNLDKTKEAEKILSRYNESLPDVLIPTVGMLEMRKGNLEKGNTFYKKALDSYKDSKTKTELNQIWLYEQVLYWLRKGDKQKAIDLLEEAKNLGKTYFSTSLEILQKELA